MGDYDNLISWLSARIPFEERITENYYKNRDLVEKDIQEARDYFESKNVADRKVQMSDGKWKTITREQSSEGFNGFVDNYLRDHLNDAEKETNEEAVTKIREATDLSTLDKIGDKDDINTYERNTVNTFNSNRGVFIKQEKINLREERSVILSEYEEMKRQELGRGLTASEMREAEEQAVKEKKIISREEYLKQRNEM